MADDIAKCIVDMVCWAIIAAFWDYACIFQLEQILAVYGMEYDISSGT